MGKSNSRRHRKKSSREQRFDSNGSESTRVVVLRSEGATPREVHGTLENASSGGVRLCLDDCVPNGETATIHIVVDDVAGHQDGELELEIKVRWARPDGDGKWTTGCDCETELDDDVFAMFADNGQIERRRAARRPTQVVAMARWELSLDERPIEIIDASRTGFSFQATMMGSTGDRLLARFTTFHGEEVTVAGELQWSAKTDSGYLGGCSLVNKEDHCHLMPFAIAGQSDIANRNRVESEGKTVRRRVSFAFAATVFLMFVGPSVVVLPLLLHTNREARALPAAENEPYEATAEIRLAMIDLDFPLADESATEVVSAPAQTEAPDVPTPGASTLLAADVLPLENDDAHAATSRDDESPALNVAPLPTVGAEPTPDESAKPDATATADDTDETRVERTVESATNGGPVEPANEEFRLSDEIRWPEPEIVTLEEAIAPGPAAEPAEVEPVVVEPVVVEPVVVEPAEVEPVEVEPIEVEPIEIEPVEVEPIEIEPVEIQPVAPEFFAPEPIVNESVIVPRVIAPRVITATARRRATAEFNRGREALAAGNTSEALAAFTEASVANPDVALYQYHWALALHLTDQPAAAIARVAAAADVEREHKVANWGQVMQRVQGRPRVWLQRARRQALNDG